MRIYGKHSIKAAEQNPERKHKIFFGNLQKYDEYKLNCKFIKSDEEYLETDEYYIRYGFDDFLNYNKIILLDGLMDPRNVGSIIRTAAAFGFYVILREQKGCPINSTVVQCSSGGVDHTKIAELCNINSHLKDLKDNDFSIVGLHETGKCNIEEHSSNKKIVLVIGSENTGISYLVKKDIDIFLSIKTTDFSTLNASVAASIGMFALSKNN